jgi:signal transduction histidine kinase
MRGERSILLSALPPTQAQKRLALIIAVALLVAFFICLRFRHVELPQVNAFIPVVDTLLFFNDLITAALLYAQYSVVRSRALLALAMGYLFCASIIVPHALTFPAAFSPTGLLGIQTTWWLYVVWHLGLPVAVITYALLKRDQSMVLFDSARSTIVTSAAAMILLAGALTWLATAGGQILPAIMVDPTHATTVWNYFAAPAISILTVIPIVLLWRRSSILDLWLLVVLWAWLLETVLLATAAFRFSLAWYGGRVFGLLSSCFVLLVLLSESTVLYTRLALSSLAQNREREGRLISLDAMSAAIEHELRQPLAAIVMYADAGLRWLDRELPQIEEVRGRYKRIAAEGHRASEVIKSVRAMFSEKLREKTLIDTNDLIKEAIALARHELEMAGIVVQIELADGLPLISAHRGQLQQVILNLLTNAVDAMRGIDDRARLLRVKSYIFRPNGVAISVEDSGPGVDPKNADRIFDAFFTTKNNGMGMGLAICHSIVAAHGGSLTLAAGQPYGAIFHVRLPSQQ